MTLGCKWPGVPSSVMGNLTLFRVGDFCFINSVLCRSVWCVRERAGGVVGVAQAVCPLRGPHLGGSEPRACLQVGCQEVLPRGLYLLTGQQDGPRFAPVGTLGRQPARDTQDSVGAEEPRAFARSGEPGTDPLLARLWRRFGFRSFLVMTHPMFGQWFQEREDERGQGVHRWVLPRGELTGLRRGPCGVSSDGRRAEGQG